MVYLYILLCKASRYAQPWVVAIKKTIIIIVFLASLEGNSQEYFKHENQKYPPSLISYGKVNREINQI